MTPDSFVYDWHTETIHTSVVGKQRQMRVPITHPPFTALRRVDSKDPTLNDNQIRHLASLCLTLQATIGKPVDIEWVYHEDTFYFLQVRTVTQINFSSLEGEWSTADFKDGGVSSAVCSAFMWSLYECVWENSLPAFFRAIGLYPKSHAPKTWIEMFYGRPYWSLSGVKAAYSQLPGYCERSFDEDVGIEVCYEGNGVETPSNVRTVLKGLGMLVRFKFRLSRWEKGLTRYKVRQEKRFQAQGG